MPRLVSVARGKAVIATSLALLAGGIATGCDTQEEADLERGRDLFSTGCGTCHALTEARAGAVIGPDLDSSFAQARANGMDQDTIEGIVEAQIDNPRDVDEGDPDYDQLYMPADIFEGSDAQDVAAYVASVAGVEGIEPPPLGDGKNIFLQQCAGCHQLEAAGSAGGVGPNLDEVLAGQDAAMIEESIRDPQAEISPGFEPGIMPQYTDDAIPDENLQDLIDYLLESAGGGSAGSGASSGDSGGG
ncbi:MAG: c-type cytochrome [Actinomycetota bacterium]|nr:c-type cytochrome [Actinomycetota bacterium]